MRGPLPDRWRTLAGTSKHMISGSLSDRMQLDRVGLMWGGKGSIEGARSHQNVVTRRIFTTARGLCGDISGRSEKRLDARHDILHVASEVRGVGSATTKELRP